MTPVLTMAFAVVYALASRAIRQREDAEDSALWAVASFANTTLVWGVIFLTLFHLLDLRTAAFWALACWAVGLAYSVMDGRTEHLRSPLGYIVLLPLLVAFLTDDGNWLRFTFVALAGCFALLATRFAPLLGLPDHVIEVLYDGRKEPPTEHGGFWWLQVYLLSVAIAILAFSELVFLTLGFESWLILFAFAETFMIFCFLLTVLVLAPMDLE